jgi:hypothetical protein
MLDDNDPNLLDPVTNNVDEVIVCATIVCAVSVPLTVKLSAEDAVAALEELTAFSTYDDVTAFCAQLEVPNKEPVIEGDVVLVDTIKEFKAPSEPETSNFFQFGIVFYFAVRYLEIL